MKYTSKDAEVEPREEVDSNEAWRLADPMMIHANDNHDCKNDGAGEGHCTHFSHQPY